ncbi:MAG: DUF3298 domain-containing protein [Paludibacteraceae bacterium]|nr:DUF3298 domain-containing protein [Paludibacteraceae bacterium]
MNKKRKSLFSFSAWLAIALLLCGCSQKEKKNVANPIQFQTYTLQKEFKGDSIIPPIAVDLRVEYPTQYPDRTILKKIQLAVLRSVLGDKAINNPADEMEKMAENIINEHKEKIMELTNNPQIEDGDCLSNTYHQTSQEVLFNQDGILTIQTADSSHYGGSKGIKFLYYNNFDLKTGNDLKYSDLFIEDSEEMLSSFIIQKLMVDNQIEDESQLEENGFIDLSEIKPINNFKLDTDGITFVYNPSEIACLALGIIKVTLSYEEIRLLMKEGSLLSKFVD